MIIMHGINHNSRNNKGITLVELMIAIVISSILALGIVQIFAANKRSYNLEEDSSRMQEAGRYAFNMLMQDLRRAGFFGGNANIDDITGTSGIVTPTNTCPADNTWPRMIQRRIVGLNDSNSGYACIPNADYLRGDIVTVRYTDGRNATGFDDNRLYIRNSLFEGRLFLGKDQGDSDNDVYETPKAAHLLEAYAYYVGPSGRNCRFQDSSGNAIPIPALFREALDANASPVKEEVAGNIEHLQFQYGIDETGDGAVNRYYNANSISNDEAVTPNWTQVVTVRFWVLARADCPTANYTNSRSYVMGDVNYTPNDGFKRQLFSSTVMLRN